MRLLALNAVLLALVAGASIAIQVDRAGAAVDSSVRRYAAGISNSDFDAAMAEISPEQRAQWADFVHAQLGNVYTVRGIAVRSPSILQRVLLRRPASPTEVTAVMDVDRDSPADFYQPTVRVTVQQVDGRWYLAEPLLANQ